MTPFTLFHVVLSLVGIGSGLVIMYGMLRAKSMNSGTALFLATTVLTSLTGFGLPAHKLMPSHIVGIISLFVLAVAIFSRYARRLAGGWRPAYVITAAIALYLNVVVLIIQLFEKVPDLKALAPTQSELPFVVTQVVVMAVFLAVTVLAAKRFHPEEQRGAAAMAKAA